MVNVGDIVQYVPAIGHAFDLAPDGTYPWEIGLSNSKGVVTTILTPKQVTIFLEQQRRVPRSSKGLIPIRPLVSWEAKVTQVHGDGSCDMDIDHPMAGLTLGYQAVKEDAKGTKPHSWHVPSGE